MLKLRRLILKDNLSLFLDLKLKINILHILFFKVYVERRVSQVMTPESKLVKLGRELR